MTTPLWCLLPHSTARVRELHIDGMRAPLALEKKGSIPLAILSRSKLEVSFPSLMVHLGEDSMQLKWDNATESDDIWS